MCDAGNYNGGRHTPTFATLSSNVTRSSKITVPDVTYSPAPSWCSAVVEGSGGTGRGCSADLVSTALFAINQKHPSADPAWD